MHVTAAPSVDDANSHFKAANRLNYAAAKLFIAFLYTIAITHRRTGPSHSHSE